jgi:GAF domain-containing protein
MQASAFPAPSAGEFSAESRQALAPLLDLAMSETNAQGAYLYHFDAPSGAGRVVLWAGLSPTASAGPLELPAAAIRSHFGRQTPIILHERAGSDPRFEALPEFRANRFEGVVSIPLLDAGRVIGMLNVCRSRQVAVRPRELSFLLGIGMTVGALLAAVAARTGLEREVERLTQELAGRKAMERAKGIVQTHFRYTEEQAYFYLRNLSRRRRIPLPDVALEVIRTEASQLPQPEKSTGERT